MSLLQNSNAIESGGYLIERSLRFQSASSQYLTRTPSSAGDRTKFTWSSWVKVGTIGTWKKIFSAWNANTDAGFFDFGINNNNTFTIQGWNTTWRLTTQVFRDPSAWYHIVVAIDTTQATAANRIKLYINGSEVTAFSTSNNPTQNYNFIMNTNVTHYIGTDSGGGFVGTSNFDGYMTEINFIDGQALTPSSFGETDTLTGVWVAKRYTGTYGTNGFYLKFNDGTSTTTLGQDRSGNANNWTLTNFTRSAGINDCWMYDVPSGNGSVSATQPSSNYPVVNPLKGFGTNWTFSKANLNITYASNNSMMAVATMRTGSSGKYYFEVHDTVMSSTLGFIGITTEAYADANTPNIVGYYRSGGTIANLAGTLQTSGAAYAGGNVIGVAVDIDNGTCQFYKNGVAQGATPSFTFTAGTIVVPYVGADNVAGTKTFDLNFGQRSFAYTPPSGFKALCTANLPAPTIAKGNQYMDATLYTGNGGTQTITNAGSFSPDLVWLKGRSVAYNHGQFDTVRGAGKSLSSSVTGAEVTNDVDGYLSAFTSNGFTLTAGTTSSFTWNQNAQTFVAWQWDAGSSTVTNTSGSISSQVRANTTAGFSIVTYTGNNTAGATIGHGLGIAPKMVIVKRRNGSIANWRVYHAGLTSAAYNIFLSLTNAQTLDNTIWNSTAPTSTVFTVGNSADTNTTSDYVAYCFAEIAGFSRFGSYTGNGSADGPFAYCGFRPKFVMIKRTDVADNWEMRDTSRDTYNVQISRLRADLSAAEVTTSGEIDITSNGFKLRNINSAYNTSAGTYIFMAFAENPFNYSNAR